MLTLLSDGGTTAPLATLAALAAPAGAPEQAAVPAPAPAPAAVEQATAPAPAAVSPAPAAVEQDSLYLMIKEHSTACMQRIEAVRMHAGSGLG